MTEREIILFQNPATDISIGKQNSNKICVKASHQIKTRCILMASLLSNDLRIGPYFVL